MLDQQVVRLAHDRIMLEIVAQKQRITDDIGRINGEMAVRGLAQSGARIQRITSLCSDAAKDRAQIAWQTLYRFLTTAGVKYYDGLAEELKRLVAQYLPENLNDLKGYVQQAVGMLNNANLTENLQQQLKSSRSIVLAKINGEIDLFVISLREREKMSSEKSGQPIFNIYSPVGSIQTGINATAYSTQYMDSSTQERLLNTLNLIDSP